ncbi:protein SRG1-like [Telopea speciosissima]|uniref:protein SRG1-like n=1 Tax=Telopea speciosissima TaxID=54955 RepID=UPI001CC69E71|nr:protein SRG1-like [Telopea speciosissima]
MESSAEVLTFGASLLVPSVQELAKEPLITVPPRYAHPDQDPPIITDTASLPVVPVLDIQLLISEEPTKDLELKRLDYACREWGFFQIVNHGISNSLIEKIKSEVQDFFQLPSEEKKKLWQKPDDHEGFGQLFVVSGEQKLDWCDMFYITTLPTNLRKQYLFGKLPHPLRDTLETYSSELSKLAMIILDQMARALKMDAGEMRELFNDGVQSMRLNYYPPCPQPDLAIGFTPHSDADALTILLQLNDTEGLQIRKEGKWVPVKPIPNAFVVNVGDIMEIMSNGVYRSIEHRATVNSWKERLSIATFYSTKLDAELGPAPSLIGANNPAMFRRVPVEKYFKEFFALKLSGKSYLDFMRIQNGEKSH